MVTVTFMPFAKDRTTETNHRTIKATFHRCSHRSQPSAWELMPHLTQVCSLEIDIVPDPDFFHCLALKSWEDY